MSLNAYSPLISQGENILVLGIDHTTDIYGCIIKGALYHNENH